MEKPMWMVRCDGGALYDTFRQQSIVALGWVDLRDAKKGDSKADLLKRKRERTRDESEGTALSGVSQVWRFINSVAESDLVVTYNPQSRRYLVGEIAGEADNGAGDSLSQQRAVRWMGEVDRDSLSVASRNSLGSTLTLFQIPAQAADELLRGVKTVVFNDTVQSYKALSDEEEAIGRREVVESQNDNSFELIKDKLAKLDGYEFQELIAGILRAMGYRTRLSKPGADRGIDVLASPDGFGFESPRITVEVKHRAAKMGAQDLRSFLGGRRANDKALYVSSGGFTQDAKYEADRATIPVMLWDFNDVVQALIDRYEQLDIETRQLIPLRKIYLPV